MAWAGAIGRSSARASGAVGLEALAPRLDCRPQRLPGPCLARQHDDWRTLRRPAAQAVLTHYVASHDQTVPSSLLRRPNVAGIIHAWKDSVIGAREIIVDLSEPDISHFGYCVDWTEDHPVVPLPRGLFRSEPRRCSARESCCASKLGPDLILCRKSIQVRLRCCGRLPSRPAGLRSRLGGPRRPMPECPRTLRCPRPSCC